ncbi:hypothetical protein F4818DRAFT_432171 [Hypoxylon cercidicola]|nr:hypothetical protein F4818DRAFT_432171 [Hypoxylon cercidicola]
MIMSRLLVSRTNLEENRGPGFRTFCIIMAVLPSITVLLRIWSRVSGKNSRRSALPKFWWDDWTCLIAWVLLVCSIIIFVYLVELGFGHHLETIPLDSIIKFHKVLLVIQLLSFLGMALAKSSALLFYQRVFDRPGSRVRYAILITHILNIAWWITFTVEVLAHCQPIQKTWSPFMKEGFCFNGHTVYLGYSVISVIIDLLILLIPVPILWKLKLSALRKLMVTFIFVMGYGVIVGSLGRLIELYYTPSEAFNTDYTYVGVPIMKWSIIEATIALISICLPAIWSLIRSIGRKTPVLLVSSAKRFKNTARHPAEVLLQSHDLSSGHSVSRYVALENEGLGDSLELEDHVQTPVATYWADSWDRRAHGHVT